MSIKTPWLPFYYKDYVADAYVRGMTRDQDLAYRRMIEASWEMGGLPAEPEKLALHIAFPLEVFTEEVWRYPLTECWAPGEDGLLRNARLESIREGAEAKIEQRRAAANTRWAKTPPGDAPASPRNATAMRDDTSALLPHNSALRAQSDPDPDPDPDPERSSPVRKVSTIQEPPPPRSSSGKALAKKKRAPPKKKPPPTAAAAAAANEIIRWSKEEADFKGDKPRLRIAVFERYDEHGEKWIQAVWKSCRVWCMDNEEAIEKTKNHYNFVLNWFRREAQRKEERA